MNNESPVHTRKVSTKAIENEEIEAQVAANGIVGMGVPFMTQ
jgi:hypothetical protein